MAFDDLKRAAEAHYRQHGVYALSMYSRPDLTAAEIAQVVGGEALPHQQMRASTVGRLRGNGFEVVPSEPPPAHVDVLLQGPLTEEVAAALVATFNPPEPNPVALSGGTHV